MGKRKYQRVVLILGLLFLIIVICGILLWKMVAWQETESYKLLGQLLTKHPELEVDFIEAYAGLSENNYEAAGKSLIEKYGYETAAFGGPGGEVSYGISIFMVLVIGTVLILSILIYYEYKQKRGDGMEESKRERLLEMEERNQVLLEKLTMEERNTKELITDISHQLKTPLASLKMSYEIAQTDAFTMQERAVFLKQGRSEINKLESFLEALLNIARLETGMIQMKPVAASLKDTLIAAVNGIFMKAHEKKIELVLEDMKELKFRHDVKWTQEAITNVLDNAIKYSEANTTIKIRVSPLLTYVVIEIIDEGIGIPPKECPNIFKRFYRGGSERIQNTEGSGVGLYLVRKILEEQGGTVCVKPGIPCGSIFILTLPKINES